MPKSPTLSAIRLSLITTLLMAACTHPTEQWYKAGASQQDFYQTRQHCDNETANGPIRTSIVSAMWQQSYLFNGCMENNGYAKIDSASVASASLVTTAPLPIDPISNDPRLKAAYCFGDFRASADFIEKTVQGMTDIKPDKLPGTIEAWQAAAAKAQKDADAYRDDLTGNGLYSADPNQIPQGILQSMATGGQEAKDVITEIMQKKGALMCQNACPDYNPSYPTQRSVCVQACGPETAEEQRIMACEHTPPN